MTVGCPYESGFYVLDVEKPEVVYYHTHDTDYGGHLGHCTWNMWVGGASAPIEIVEANARKLLKVVPERYYFTRAKVVD